MQCFFESTDHEKRTSEILYLVNALQYVNSTDAIQHEKTARFWGPPQRFVYINRNKMICEYADGVSRALIAAPDWIDGGSSLCRRGSTILFVSAHQSKPQYGRNMTLVSLSESAPCYVQ